MTSTKLHDALHDVAATGVGSDVDATLARVAAKARVGGGRPPRWRMPALIVVAATATVALLVTGLFAVTRPPEVVPASGPGSLPDQIFPTREHILTLEQAPIGRVSMVYAGAWANGGPAWIAVGADSDEYRWVAPVETPPDSVDSESTAVAVSPDGSMVAVGYSGDSADAFHVAVISAASGEIGWLSLGDSESDLGGVVEALGWSPSGARLVAEVRVTEQRWKSAERSRAAVYVADIGEDLRAIGWIEGGLAYRNESSVVGWGRGDRAVSVVSRASGDGVLLQPNRSRPIGRLDEVPTYISPESLGDGAPLFAGLDDPTVNVSGDGSWILKVFDTSTGRVIDEVPGLNEYFSEVIGWRDEGTPVVSEVVVEGRASNNANVVGQLVAYPVGGEPEILTVAPIGTSKSYYTLGRVAQDVLAAGEVRVAEPPHQPWYDPRTLGPAVVDWARGSAVLLGLLVVLVVVPAGVAVARRRARP